MWSGCGNLGVVTVCFSQRSFPSQLAEDAGFPPGVVNTIPCSRNNVDEVANAILGNDLVAKFSFTGSTATGKVMFPV